MICDLVLNNGTERVVLVRDLNLTPPPVVGMTMILNRGESSVAFVVTNLTWELNYITDGQGITAKVIIQISQVAVLSIPDAEAASIDNLTD